MFAGVTFVATDNGKGHVTCAVIDRHYATKANGAILGFEVFDDANFEKVIDAPQLAVDAAEFKAGGFVGSVFREIAHFPGGLQADDNFFSFFRQFF